MRAKLIRKIPAREGLPHWFDEYEFECIDCGAHYFRGRCDSRISPYCCECYKKHEKEKNKEYRENKEKKIINAALRDVKAEIEKLHAWGDSFGNIYVLFDGVIEIIDNYMSGRENT